MAFFRYFKKKDGPTKKELARQRFKGFVTDLRLRGASDKTIDAYLYHNNRFLEFVRKEPRSVSSKDIKRYTEYLIDNNKEARTVNLALSSIRAYYEGFLGRKLFSNIKRMKQPRDMPNVLSRSEIKALIDNIKSLKHRLLIVLLYSSGMRVGECVKVKVNDIDFDEKIIYVKRGKGKKDRFTIASDRFFDELKEYLASRNKYSDYVFNNANGRSLSTRMVQEILKLAAERAGIQKRVYPHLLRASFATHLIENDVRIHKVQRLLGHADRRTTEGYIRLRTDDLKRVKSPLDI